MIAPDAAFMQRVLDRALGAGDYADAFYERREVRAFRLRDGRVHEANVSLTCGIGIRTLSGESAGYAYSEDISEAAVVEAARAAALIARGASHGARTVRLASAPAMPLDLYGAPDPSDVRADASRYVDLLARADVAARAFDPRISNVNAVVSCEVQDVVVASSDGTFVTERRPLVALAVQCIAMGTKRGTGQAGDGARGGLYAFDERTPEAIAREAARIACVAADAIEAPAGEFEVVVGAGSGGVLLHEAVGHGLEGDFNLSGASLYAGRVGERVASELVTICDDGDLPCERGTVGIDDEGTPGSKNVLVERGVLRGYLHDVRTARAMGARPTGSGRRQSYRYLPQPRMCNTYMPPGGSTHEEIVGSVRRGIYATSFVGGQVEISKGDFVFMLAEGYLIENGRLTAPIRGASLIGNGPDVMERVTMVGNDLRIAGRHYTCGKAGQMVPVGIGMPTVKVSRVTVGGSSVGS